MSGPTSVGGAKPIIVNIIVDNYVLTVVSFFTMAASQQISVENFSSLIEKKKGALCCGGGLISTQFWRLSLTSAGADHNVLYEVTGG